VCCPRQGTPVRSPIASSSRPSTAFPAGQGYALRELHDKLRALVAGKTVGWIFAGDAVASISIACRMARRS